jgi:pyruvate formate lyase activating enzyme
MDGMVFDIQRFSTHDGEGIRTIVFFKGCPLRCAWCENPESQLEVSELLFDPKHCIDCASCLEPAAGGLMHRSPSGGIVPVRGADAGNKADDTLYNLAELCPSRAIRVAGRRMSLREILGQVMKDEAFFRKSGGGVTFSGGEPLLQWELVLQLSRELSSRGVDCAVETCLAFGGEALEALLGQDLTWLVDLKHTDAKAFLEGTGGDLLPVMANLGRLAASGAKIVYRVPVIPGFNDDDASMGSIMEYAAALPRDPTHTTRMDLLPYHDLAAGKYAALGRHYPYHRGLSIPPAFLRRHAEAGAALGLEVSIGG